MNEARWSEEAERAVLSSVLVGGEGALDLCREVGLRAHHFWQPKHELLYGTAERLVEQGLGVDSVTIMATLPERERVQVGFTLSEVASAPVGVSPGMLGVHARTLVALAELRALGEAGRRIVGYSGDAPADRAQEALERARQALDEVDQREGPDTAVRLSELVEGVVELAEHGITSGLALGYPTLDDMLAGGPTPGQLVLVGARPSVGKTTLACNMARVVARRGEPTVFFSLEMTRDELAQRFVSMESGVPLKRIRAGALREEDWERIAKATSRVDAWPLLIDDKSSQTVGDMRARLRKASRKGSRPRFVVVDFTQIVRPTDARVPREQQVSAIAEGLKAMAKDFRCVVVALAQLNRGPEQRRTQAPMLSDLRESGALEQVADVVVLMHSDPKAPDEMRLLLLKNRQGEKGQLSLVWQPSVMRALPSEEEQRDQALWDARTRQAGG